MSGLDLNLFLQAGADFERTQYRVLDALQQMRRAFSQNIVYPHLGALIGLYGTLNNIVGNLGRLRDALPGQIESIDPETYRLIRQKPELRNDGLVSVEELIRWALPLMQDAIEEGRTIFEFVEENLHMEEVGILPAYVEEGYLIMPDRPHQQLHILRYTLSVFTSADEKYRSLKTAYVKSLPRQDVYPSPRSIKLDLVAEEPDLPNPATYFFATDLDFPFEATVLPVAKRKLMRYLFAQGGAA